MPLLGALAGLVAFGDTAEAADEAGHDGMLVRDHVLSPVEGNWAIADPWVALAVAATRSWLIRIGPTEIFQTTWPMLEHGKGWGADVDLVAEFDPSI